MEDVYTQTVDSPVKDLRVMDVDTNAEDVLDVCGYVSDSEDQLASYVPDSEDQLASYVPDSEDQLENNGETETVCDSDDEDLVTPKGTRRLSGRTTLGLSNRRQTSTGLFRRVGQRSGEHGFLSRDPTRNPRSGEESNASRTCLDNPSRNQDHNVAVDSVISSLPDKQRTSEPESDQELCENQEILKMAVENMNKVSIDRKQHLSGNWAMEGDAGCELDNNHDESTEPIESQSKVLEFVDQYLSLNDLGSFGDVKEAKQINRIRSPPSLSSKGSLCLAKKISLGFTGSKYANFDWEENPIEGGCTFSKTRKDSTFGFKDDKHEQSSVSKESGDVNVHNAQVDVFDVGPDTQMAAEAMQSLINSPLPSSDAQQPGNTWDSSTIVYRRSRFKSSANPREAFIGWKNKSKRSKPVIISTRKVQMKASAQLPVSESLLTNTLVSRNDVNITDLRYARNSNLAINYSTPVTADKTKQGNFNTDVAHSGPRSTRHCYTIASEDDNIAQTELLVYNRRRKRSELVPRNETNAQPELLVYNRRRKCSSERKRSGSASNVSGSPSPIHIDIGASKPLNQLHELEDVKLPCSVDNSGTFKLNELSNGKSSTLQACELRDRSKYQSKHPLRSHQKNELTRLGHLKSSPAFLPKVSRMRRAMEKVCVLFSQNLDMIILKKQKKIVERLGFSIASCCADATHFIADRFMRTRNMMEAIALGKPVVTHLWLESCDQAGYCIDEKSYILRDEKKEKEIGFSMPLTLARASHHSLLKGCRVFITTNVKPSVDVITCLVRAVQSQVVQNIRGAESEDGTIARDLLILSSVEDYEICMPFLEKGASIYDSELLLHGIITQKLDYERHQIFKDFAESRSSCSPQRRKKRKISNGGLKLRKQLVV